MTAALSVAVRGQSTEAPQLFETIPSLNSVLATAAISFEYVTVFVMLPGLAFEAKSINGRRLSSEDEMMTYLWCW